jgi:hypothetical protein
VRASDVFQVQPTPRRLRGLPNPTHGSGWMSSSPAYIDEARATSPIPPTAVGGCLQVQAAISEHIDEQRSDLNYPPTAVGGIVEATRPVHVVGPEDIHPLPWVGLSSFQTVSSAAWLFNFDLRGKGRSTVPKTPSASEAVQKLRNSTAGVDSGTFIHTLLTEPQPAVIHSLSDAAPYVAYGNTHSSSDPGCALA